MAANGLDMLASSLLPILTRLLVLLRCSKGIPQRLTLLKGLQSLPAVEGMVVARQKKASGFDRSSESMEAHACIFTSPDPDTPSCFAALFQGNSTTFNATEGPSKPSSYPNLLLGRVGRGYRVNVELLSRRSTESGHQPLDT